MKATVIIPTRNGGDLFRRVLDAVLAQVVPWPFEVIVIDSGSSDRTVECIRSRPDVVLMQIPAAEFGHSRTRNAAVGRANGEYAIMLTQDALPASNNWLSSLVAVAETDASIAGVFGRHIAYPDASPFVRRELEVHFAGFRSAPLARLDDKERYGRDSGYRQFLHFFSSNNSLLRRSVWRKIPYPEVDFAEDQAWAQRIIEAGYAKAYAHDAAVFHSHDYGLIERLQRSFDEGAAFKRRTGDGLCDSLGSFARSWLALNRRDWRVVLEDRLWCCDLRATSLFPLDNLMRSAGHCLGSCERRLPAWLIGGLSRDRGLRGPANGEHGTFARR